MPRAWSSIPVADEPHHSAACSIRAGRHAGDGGRPRRRHVGDGRGRAFEVDGVLVDERVVEQVAPDQLVEHGAEERRVGARPHREEQVGGAGQRDDARVLHDQPGPTVARPPDVARGDREGLGDVRAGDPHHVGEGDVAPRVGVAVDAERLLVGGAGGHHAEASVVVEVRRVQGEAGELADQVALLVRERDAGEHGEGVIAVGRLDAADLGDDAVEGGVPRDRAEAPGCRRITHHRVQQAVGVAALEVTLDALRAQLALVERELVPRFEADDGVVADLQLDAALLTAEAAVRLHDAVGVDLRIPAAGRGDVEVRAVAGDQLLLGDGELRHQPNPPTRADWASVTWARRHRGHVSW